MKHFVLARRGRFFVHHKNTHLDPSELTDPSESLEPCLMSLDPCGAGITSELRWTPLVAWVLRPPRSQSTYNTPKQWVTIRKFEIFFLGFGLLSCLVLLVGKWQQLFSALFKKTCLKVESWKLKYKRKEVPKYARTKG